MKYCAKCGTRMPDNTMVCPKCYPEINNQQSQVSSQANPPKNTSNKIIPLISTNIILSVLILTALIIMYLIPPSINNSANNNSNSSSTHYNTYNSTCPADEYGNHNWAPANCTEPAQCYNCNGYRDDNLGNHFFYTYANGLCHCSYCGILYEVYMNSLD